MKIQVPKLPIPASIAVILYSNSNYSSIKDRSNRINSYHVFISDLINCDKENDDSDSDDFHSASNSPDASDEEFESADEGPTIYIFE